MQCTCTDPRSFCSACPPERRAQHDVRLAPAGLARMPIANQRERIDEDIALKLTGIVREQKRIVAWLEQIAAGHPDCPCPHCAHLRAGEAK